MKRVVFFALFFLLPTSLVSGLTSFTISTPEQWTLPGSVSEKIIIHASDAVSDTTYISYISSSGTGEFVTASGTKLKSAYISKGDTNRAVYYRDTTVGDFQLTFIVTDKAKETLATLTQIIHVGSKPEVHTSSKQVQIAPVIKTVSTSHAPKKPIETQSLVSTSSLAQASTSEITETATVFIAPVSKGFLSTLFAWPIRFIDFLRNLFFEH